jgi:hypothetical protein
MEVFLSWSGERSRRVSSVFLEWLPEVIQSLRPWMSEDIDKGRRWDDQIASRLDNSNIGIICLTADNLDSNWLHFEAGALSKRKDDSSVCTFLLDVARADVRPPLGLFQHTVFEKDDVFRLLRNINERLVQTGLTPLSDSVLQKSFNRCWGDLEGRLQEIASDGHKAVEHQRSERDLLEEMLETLRRIERSDRNSSIVKFGNRPTVTQGGSQSKSAASRQAEGLNLSNQLVGLLLREHYDHTGEDTEEHIIPSPKEIHGELAELVDGAADDESIVKGARSVAEIMLRHGASFESALNLVADFLKRERVQLDDAP